MSERLGRSDQWPETGAWGRFWGFAIAGSRSIWLWAQEVQIGGGEHPQIYTGHFKMGEIDCWSLFSASCVCDSVDFWCDIREVRGFMGYAGGPDWRGRTPRFTHSRDESCSDFLTTPYPPENPSEDRRVSRSAEWVLIISLTLFFKTG